MTRRLLFGCALGSPILLIVLWRYSPALAVGQMLLSHLLIVYATLRPNVQWLGEVITSFEASRPEVWLTIDDGPAEDTGAVLDVLARHAAVATFFVKGSEAEADNGSIAEMLGRGHSVANHSFSHPSGTFWCLTPSAIASEIDRANAVLTALTGSRPRWFRAPVGMKNPAVHPLLRARGMRLIGWTVRGLDAMGSDADDITRRIVRRLHPGAIIVLHQGRRHSSSVLEKVIVEIRRRGYEFVIPDDARLKTSR